MSKFPGRPLALVEEVIDDAASPIVSTHIEIGEAEKLFTLYYFKGNSMSFTFLYFKSPTSIPEAVEFAKKFCVTNLNARFLRVELAIHVIE